MRRGFVETREYTFFVWMLAKGNEKAEEVLTFD
jgi:hypothetical protein